MRKYLLLTLLLIYSNLSKSNNYIFEGFISSKDTNQIHQIKFITGRILGNNYSNQLPENDNYNLTIDESGKTLLEWVGKCPQSLNNSINCSYSGIITKKQFKKLSNKLNKIKFTELLNIYKPFIEYEHTESEHFIITYNYNIEKIIIDQNFEIKELRELSKMLIKLKKEIKWVPNK
jgi:hypothetical protein